ncbi:Uncharacterized protein Fot_14398 [Forsythia ovata]|uniref:Uncharacterized protein n=1 Tax=Forsythia ovata TaxID=205694 RepID=A0ABD1W9T4_9LAMI
MKQYSATSNKSMTTCSLESDAPSAALKTKEKVNAECTKWSLSSRSMIVVTKINIPFDRSKFHKMPRHGERSKFCTTEYLEVITTSGEEYMINKYRIFFVNTRESFQ